MRFDIAQEFDCTPDEFWAVFFDEEYNTELYRRLKSRRTVVRSDDQGDRVDREIKIELGHSVPGFVEKLLSGPLGYIERSTFHKTRKKLDVRVDVPVAGGRVAITGDFDVAAVGAKTRRRWAGDIAVKVPLVGGKVESILVDNMVKDYETASAVTRDWIVKKRSAK
jgi:hypothetical protein